MRRAALLFSVCILPSAVCVTAADSVLPAPLPPARYVAMRQKSPFAPPTVAAMPVATPGFAVDWFVSGLAKIGDKDFVTIQSRDGQKRFSLFVGEPGPDGITLTKIDWAPEIAKSKAVVKKGTETASLEFDQAAASRAAGALAQMPFAAGGQPPPTPPMRGPILPNSPPRPQSFDARALPSPGAAQVFQPGQPDQRRRIRIINSPPHQ